MKNRLKRITQGLLLATGATVVTLIGHELIVRLVAPQQLIAFHRVIRQPKDGVGWHHAPHADSWINTGKRDKRFQTATASVTQCRARMVGASLFLQ